MIQLIAASSVNRELVYLSGNEEFAQELNELINILHKNQITISNFCLKKFFNYFFFKF